MKTGFLAVLLALAGCTQTVWLHPNHNDQATFNRDSYECERDMRQSGYYGRGLIGQINAQEFADRCMIARGYYKASREALSQTTAKATASSPRPAPVAAPPSPPPAVQAPPAQSVSVESPAAPLVTKRAALLFLIRGPIVSDPPQSFSGEFSSNGKAQVMLSNRRIVQGDFQLFELSDSVSAKYQASLIKPDTLKPPAGTDMKGFAALSDDSTLKLECAYAIAKSSGRGEGTCADNERNTYRIVFK